MTTFTTGRWLLLALALVALAVAAPTVSAHGDETAPGDAPPDDGTADDRAAWTGAHVTDHVGAGSAGWMDSHADVPVDGMADGDHRHGTYHGHDRRPAGQGHGC